MKAVVVFSGGIDSVCTVAYLQKCYDIYGITFSYGQKANQELNVAKHFSEILEFREHKVIDIGFMKELYEKTNALTYSKMNIPSKFDYSIVVPIRNAVFLSIASAWAFSKNANLVAYGAHKDDQSYPDCRPKFSKLLTNALNEGEIDGIKKGLRKKIRIWSPFIEGLSKSNLLKIGYDLLGDDIFKTWSCYSQSKIHCGKCESCNNRKMAFRQANMMDKTRYRFS
ncbi:MAG: 7-cyano-7-deazaguanine synthase [Thaumarchaeota archaeon]|nr:7-cyano-7-deazaguanine synthase [Nitrososphaerota archaeon]MDE1866964.1 7-cyano-7-deazaguanine synthase [Nitrososphaerota archaeon]